MDDRTDQPNEAILESLPTHARWEFRETWVEFDFLRVVADFRDIKDADISGDIPAEWLSFRVFGEETFSNGSALLCINGADGSIIRLDVELDDPVSVLNSGMSRFVGSFLALDGWLTRGQGTREDVDQALRAIDPGPYERGSQWQVLVTTSGIENGSPTSACTRRPTLRSGHRRRQSLRR